MEDLLRKSIKLTVILVLAIAAALAIMHQVRFALGLLVSASWSIINFALLIKILEIAMLHKPRNKLFLILMIKFPLLYLIGFLILASKFFPAYSLLAGLGSILFMVGVIAVCPKHT